MHCKELYAVNSASQVLLVGEKVDFGGIVRRYTYGLGSIGLENGDVVVTGNGYYTVDTNFTFEAGGAGIATVTMYQDGVAIPGATSSRSTADGVTYALSIPAKFKVTGCSGCSCQKTSVITVVVSGVPVTVTNATILVDKT